MGGYVLCVGSDDAVCLGGVFGFWGRRVVDLLFFVLIPRYSGWRWAVVYVCHFLPVHGSCIYVCSKLSPRGECAVRCGSMVYVARFVPAIAGIPLWATSNTSAATPGRKYTFSPKQLANSADDAPYLESRSTNTCLSIFNQQHEFPIRITNRGLTVKNTRRGQVSLLLVELHER